MSSFLLFEFGGDCGQFVLPWTHFVDFLEVFILGDWSPLIFKTGVSFSRCSLAPLSSISRNSDSPPAFWYFFQSLLVALLYRNQDPVGTSGKEPACQCKRCMRCGFHPWVGKSPWRRAQQPTPPLQYSFLENPMERGHWWAWSTGSQRVMSDWSDLAHTHTRQPHGSSLSCMDHGKMYIPSFAPANSVVQNPNIDFSILWAQLTLAFSGVTQAQFPVSPNCGEHISDLSGWGHGTALIRLEEERISFPRLPTMNKNHDGNSSYVKEIASQTLFPLHTLTPF